MHCICTYSLTGRLSALYLVVLADGKLQTLWNWFLSPTLLSLCEFILLVSTKGLSLHNSFLSKHFIFRKCVFFFFLFFFLYQEAMSFDHIWKQWCRRKMTSSMTGWKTMEQHFNLFLWKSVRTSGQLQQWLIYTTSCSSREDTHHSNSSKGDTCHVTLNIRLLMDVFLKKINLFNHPILWLQCPHFNRKEYNVSVFWNHFECQIKPTKHGA